MKRGQAPSRLHANMSATVSAATSVVSAVLQNSNKRQRRCPDPVAAQEPIAAPEPIPVNTALANDHLLFNPFAMDSDSEIEEPGRPEEVPTQVDVELEASFVVDEEDGGEEELGGEEDLDRQVPDVWDHPQDLEMDWEGDNSGNAVERMVQCIGEKKLITALFTMSCSLVFDSVTTTMGVMSANDCYLAAAATFDDHINTFSMKAYPRDNLLAFLPDRQLPPAYIAYINKVKTKMPTAKALQSAAWAGIPVAQHRQILFGMLIKKKNRDTKAYVNMNLVPSYIPEEELPSGHTREQLLRAIRRSLWPLEAAARGMNAQRAAVSRSNKKGASALSAQQVKVIFEDAREKAFRKLNDNYYPPEFLVFLLFSAAAQDPSQVLASLNGGNPALAVTDPTNTAPTAALTGAAAQNSPTTAIRNMRAAGGRAARRTAERLAAAGDGQGGGARGGGVTDRADQLHAPPAPITVIHKHVVESGPLEKHINVLERLIAIALRRVASVERDGRLADYEEELMHVLEAERHR